MTGRTTAQKAADRDDLQLYRALDICRARGLYAAVNALKNARNVVRSEMHPDDREATKYG